MNKPEAALDLQLRTIERYANAEGLNMINATLQWVHRYSETVAKTVDILDDECDIITPEMLEIEIRKYHPEYPLAV